MKWLIKHNGLVVHEIDASDDRQQAGDAALTRLGYELVVAAEPATVRDRYVAWRCDDGTYDFVDAYGEIIFCNLGNGADEASAWAELARKVAS